MDPQRPLRKAQSDEMEYRNKYEQELTSKKKEMLSQTFHSTRKHKEIDPFQMDLIDDSSAEPQFTQPTHNQMQFQPQPQPQQFQPQPQQFQQFQPQPQQPQPQQFQPQQFQPQQFQHQPQQFQPQPQQFQPQPQPHQFQPQHQPHQFQPQHQPPQFQPQPQQFQPQPPPQPQPQQFQRSIQQLQTQPHMQPLSIQPQQIHQPMHQPMQPQQMHQPIQPQQMHQPIQQPMQPQQMHQPMLQPMQQPIQQPQQMHQPMHQPMHQNMQQQSNMKQMQPYSNTIEQVQSNSFQNISAEKNLIYKAFELYFDNPSFIKVNDPKENFSLYYAKVNSMVSELRYLIIISENDYHQKGTIKKLSLIPWKSFQLRVLQKETPAPEVSFKKINNGVFDDEIQLVKRDKTENKVIYQCRFNPLTVELLPSKKGSIHDYPDQSTLESAMDTFHCVIYFN